MRQQWLGISAGHGDRDAEQALTAAGFKCTRQRLHPGAELKVLVRAETSDRHGVEKILRRVNGKEPAFGLTTVGVQVYPGYREDL